MSEKLVRFAVLKFISDVIFFLYLSVPIS